jgi:hypothetical protein
MAKQITCDYCGELINEERPVALEAFGWSGGRYIRRTELAHYHATEDQPCLYEVLDRLELIHAVSSGLGPDREVIERRIEARAKREAESEAQKEAWREHRERDRAWRQTERETRERILLDALADEQLTLSQVAERMNMALGWLPGEYLVVRDSGIRQLAMSMLNSGQLERVPEVFRNKTRYRWQRKRALAGPIADLERAYDDDSEAVA